MVACPDKAQVPSQGRRCAIRAEPRCGRAEGSPQANTPIYGVCVYGLLSVLSSGGQAAFLGTG